MAFFWDNTYSTALSGKHYFCAEFESDLFCIAGGKVTPFALLGVRLKNIDYIHRPTVSIHVLRYKPFWSIQKRDADEHKEFSARADFSSILDGVVTLGAYLICSA